MIKKLNKSLGGQNTYLSLKMSLQSKYNAYIFLIYISGNIVILLATPPLPTIQQPLVKCSILAIYLIGCQEEFAKVVFITRFYNRLSWLQQHTHTPRFGRGKKN
jgi:hypothetical protein